MTILFGLGLHLLQKVSVYLQPLYVMGLERYIIPRNKGAVWSHSWSPILLPIEDPYDFLIHNMYTNLRPILPGFRDMADNMVKFSLATGGRFTLTPSLFWWPRANIRINFTTPERRMSLLNTAPSYFHSCGQNTGTLWTDGRIVSLWLLQPSSLWAVWTCCNDACRKINALDICYCAFSAMASVRLSTQITADYRQF